MNICGWTGKRSEKRDGTGESVEKGPRLRRESVAVCVSCGVGMREKGGVNHPCWLVSKIVGRQCNEDSLIPRFPPFSRGEVAQRRSRKI